MITERERKQLQELYRQLSEPERLQMLEQLLWTAKREGLQGNRAACDKALNGAIGIVKTLRGTK